MGFDRDKMCWTGERCCDFEATGCSASCCSADWIAVRRWVELERRWVELERRSVEVLECYSSRRLAGIRRPAAHAVCEADRRCWCIPAEHKILVRQPLQSIGWSAVVSVVVERIGAMNTVVE